MPEFKGTSGDDVLHGTDQPDAMDGYEGNDTIYGHGGDDYLLGSAGDDVLDGGEGVDRMDGGDGRNTYYVDNPDDVILRSGLVIASVSYALPFNIGGDMRTIDPNATTRIDLTGNNHAQTITGNAGDNVLTGGWSRDVLIGGDGNDTLIDGDVEFADVLRGGRGDDVYIIDNRDIVEEIDGEGTDTVMPNRSYGLPPGVSIEIIRWYNPDDRSTTPTIGGNELAQSIYGSASIDTLYGGGGDDHLFGLLGSDYLHGQAGADIMEGGSGNDIYYVDPSDTIVEHVGLGDDIVLARVSHTLNGGAEVEHLLPLELGGTDPINLTGNEFGQEIRGNAGVNLLIGAGGNDILSGGLGADQTDGGEGNDLHIVHSTSDLVIERAGEGDDTVLVETRISYALAADAHVETMRTPGAFDLEQINLTGNDFAQSIYGNAANNVLRGLGGSDHLVGGFGHDTLDGGEGADNLRGGGGNDVYFVDNAGDAIFEESGIGTGEGPGEDRLVASVSYVLTGGAYIEVMGTSAPEGSAAIDLTGNELGQSIYGNAGANVLSGLAGNDYLVGLAGNDTLDGGEGTDNMRGGTGNDLYRIDDADDGVFENAGEGDDRIVSSVSYALRPGVEVETLGTSAPLGTAPIALSGNEFGQSIYGNAGHNRLGGGGGSDHLVGLAGNDQLDGGAGADNMRGGTGNDLYRVDNSSDAIFENAGEGDDTAVTSVSYALAAGVEVDALVAAETAFTTALDLSGNEFGQSLWGNDGANRLDGGGGNDSLRGLGGEDRLTGGAGADFLRGGADGDRFVFNSAGDSTTAARDWILDFATGDLIDLSAIDASTAAAGDQAFAFIGSGAFTNSAGQLRAYQDGGVWIVEGDVDGNGQADLVIAVTVIDGHPLAAGDFVL